MRNPKHKYYYYPIEQSRLPEIKKNSRVTGIRLVSGQKSAVEWANFREPTAVVKIPRSRLDRDLLELLHWENDTWYYLYSGVIDITGCNLTVWGREYEEPKIDPEPVPVVPGMRFSNHG